MKRGWWAHQILVKVAKNKATEVKSPNIPRLFTFIIYDEKEENLNDPQETQMYLCGVSQVQ